MGWKHVQYKTKLKQKSKLALFVLALILGIIVISWIIRSAGSLFYPWRMPSQYAKSYTWDGQFNINLLIRTNHISLFSYNPQDEKISVYDIPDELFLDVPGGFGSWQLRSIYQMGESQKGIGGNRLLVKTLSSSFAVPVDGFLDFSGLKSAKSAREIVDTIRQNPFSGISLLSSLRTNLTFWELIRLKLNIAAVRFDKIKEVDLSKQGILDKEVLLDGSQVYSVDPVKLDSVMSGLSDPLVSKEHKSIAVFNATDHPQLATSWARMVTNLGGNVIITKNANARLKNTQVLGEQSPTLKRLSQIFSLDCQNNPKCDKISLTDEDLVSSRAVINIFLGEDYSK